MPLLIEADGLPVLVVGGGPVAARKAESFLEAGARVRVVATTPGAELRGLAARGTLAVEERAYAAGDVGDALVVIAATDDDTVNAAIAREARSLGRLVNVATSGADGNATMMAVHRAGSLVVGVSTGGVPGAAARIRDAIAERFDGRYAAALTALATIRRAMLAGDREHWPTVQREVLSPAFCRTVEDGTFDAMVATWR